jgi:hypothetical protein
MRRREEKKERNLGRKRENIRLKMNEGPTLSTCGEGYL